MGVERVDYYSDDEYRQALQEEEREQYNQMFEHEQEKLLDDMLFDLKPLIDKYGYDNLSYAIGAFVPPKKKDQENGDELPF